MRRVVRQFLVDRASQIVDCAPQMVDCAPQMVDRAPLPQIMEFREGVL